MNSMIYLLVAVGILATEGSTLQCKLKADVVFLIDSSRSIWRPHYEMELEFLVNLTTQLNVGPQQTHVGALSFSDQVRLDFFLNESMDTSELKDRLLNIPFMQGDYTNTHDGLRFAREEMFRPENGARPGVPHVIIVVTDGNQTYRAETKAQADILRQQGIQVFAVGVGDTVDREQLAELATKDSKTYVHSVSTFSNLDSILTDLIPAACTAPTTPLPDVSIPINTTPEPVESTTISENVKQLCTSKKADVVFVLDKSSSITSPHFRKQLNFVSDVMGVFSVSRDHTHISVVTFDNEPKVEFGLLAYFHKSSMRQAILNIEYTAGSTNTFLALQKVSSEVLTQEAGARSDVAQVVIVVTDGQSSNETLTTHWADTLKDSGAYVFAIGVGTQTDKQELESIGSRPASNFVFQVSEGYNALNTIKDILATRACEVPSGDEFVRCQHNALPSDVMFVTHYAHAASNDVRDTTELVKSVAGGIMTSDDKVRVGLVSGPCPDVIDVALGQSSSAEQFADAVKTAGAGSLSKVLNRARNQLTKVRSGARRGVQRLAVVILHGPVSDVDAAARKEITRAKSAVNRPGVKFLFFSKGQWDDAMDRLELAKSKVRVTVEDLPEGKLAWKQVLSRVCEEMAP